MTLEISNVRKPEEMHRNFTFFLIVFISIPILASKCDQFELDDKLEDLSLNQLDCTANESQACHCLNGWEGYQFCVPDGGSWSVCVCEAPCIPSEEVCDGIDNDCDNATDVNAVDAVTWFADRDNDGVGDPNNIWISCEAPTGYIAESGDEDDTCSTCSAPCEDLCDDEIDNDCDGLTDSDDDCIVAPLNPDAGT